MKTKIYIFRYLSFIVSISLISCSITSCCNRTQIYQPPIIYSAKRLTTFIYQPSSQIEKIFPMSVFGLIRYNLDTWTHRLFDQESKLQHIRFEIYQNHLCLYDCILTLSKYVKGQIMKDGEWINIHYVHSYVFNLEPFTQDKYIFGDRMQNIQLNIKDSYYFDIPWKCIEENINEFCRPICLLNLINPFKLPYRFVQRIFYDEYTKLFNGNGETESLFLRGENEYN